MAGIEAVFLGTGGGTATEAALLAPPPAPLPLAAAAAAAPAGVTPRFPAGEAVSPPLREILRRGGEATAAPATGASTVSVKPPPLAPSAAAGVPAAKAAVGAPSSGSPPDAAKASRPNDLELR